MDDLLAAIIFLMVISTDHGRTFRLELDSTVCEITLSGLLPPLEACLLASLFFFCSFLINMALSAFRKSGVYGLSPTHCILHCIVATTLHYTTQILLLIALLLRIYINHRESSYSRWQELASLICVGAGWEVLFIISVAMVAAPHL